MKTISLGTTQWVAQVDDEDYDYLSRFSWHLHSDKTQGIFVDHVVPPEVDTDGELIHLGSFQDEADAAYAYDFAAVKYFGDFAKTNFPVPGSRSCIFGEV